MKMIAALFLALLLTCTASAQCPGGVCRPVQPIRIVRPVIVVRAAPRPAPVVLVRPAPRPVFFFGLGICTGGCRR